MSHRASFLSYLFLLGCEFFENLPYLIETARNVETTFPLAALERKKYFALTVEITEPFGIFGVGEVCPDVVVYAVEPFEAAFVAGKTITLDHGNKCLDVYPPEFLVPFEFLSGMTFEVHEVEYAVIFFIPAIFDHLEGCLFGFFDEFGTVEAFAEVHEEPH